MGRFGGLQTHVLSDSFHEHIVPRHDRWLCERRGAGRFGPPGQLPRRLAVQWPILSPVELNELNRFTLSVEIQLTGIMPLPRRIQPTLDTVPEVPANLSRTQIFALLKRIVRIQGSQQFLLFLRVMHPVSVSVTLVDPLGRTATRQGSD